MVRVPRRAAHAAEVPTHDARRVRLDDGAGDPLELKQLRRVHWGDDGLHILKLVAGGSVMQA